MSDLMSFGKLLELGVRKMAEQDDGGLITNGSSLEEAFAIGMLEFKRRLQKKRGQIPGALSDRALHDIVGRAFPQQSIQDTVTGSYEISLSPTEKLPSQYGGFELHIFHDGSTDAHRIVMQYVKHMWFQLSPSGYATLEVIGDMDPRVPADQLNFYSMLSQPVLQEVVARFQGLLGPPHQGYAVEYLYPTPLTSQTSLISMGDFSQLKQNLFQQVWLALFHASIFHWRELAGEFPIYYRVIQKQLYDAGIRAG
jgi:hypothetical protein